MTIHVLTSSQLPPPTPRPPWLLRLPDKTATSWSPSRVFRSLTLPLSRLLRLPLLPRTTTLSAGS